MNTSTTIKIWTKTRRLLRLISAYEDKPMTAILHEMASDRVRQIEPGGKPLVESLDELFDKDDEKPKLKIVDPPTEDFRR